MAAGVATTTGLGAALARGGGPKAVNSVDGMAAGSRQLQRESSLESVSRDELRLFGNEVPATVKICVGFSTVSREKDYVLDTVRAMLGLHGGGGKGGGGGRPAAPPTALTPAERSMVVIVAHLAEWNEMWVGAMSKRLQEDYVDLVTKGQFHGIHAPAELYPTLDVCPPFCSYRDDKHRVKWRSKQNIDYAFLMYYAVPLAPYYLQIEDDLAFSSNWISKITDALVTEYPASYLSKESNAPWRLLDFSELGFIGKLFQSNELIRMAQFLLLFYDQMPCDILLGHWMRSMTQGEKIEYWKKKPSLFQHVGVFRSVGGYQPLQERAFEVKLWDNPPGAVIYNMTTVPTYDSRYAYFPGGEPVVRKDTCDLSMSQGARKTKLCFFWGKQVVAGNHLTVVFDGDVTPKAIFAQFGHEAHPTDLLTSGAVQVAAKSPTAPASGTSPLGTDKLSSCGPFVSLMDASRQMMVYWEEGVSTPSRLPVPQMRCLRLVVLRDQSQWLIISQVQVRTH